MSYEDPEDRLIDSMLDTFKNVGFTCIYCKHLNEDEMSCKAFPKGIPALIRGGHTRHTKKMFGQLNSTVFEKE